MMQTTTKRVRLAAAITALPLLAGTAGAEHGTTDASTENRTAPRIELGAAFKDGARVHTEPAEFQGVALVIGCWSQWCAACLITMPVWNEAVRAHEDNDGVGFVALTYTDKTQDAASIERFLGRQDIEGLVGVDDDKSLFQDLGVTGTPTTFFVYADGTIAKVGKPADVTNENIQRLLNGEPIIGNDNNDDGNDNDGNGSYKNGPDGGLCTGARYDRRHYAAYQHRYGPLLRR